MASDGGPSRVERTLPPLRERVGPLCPRCHRGADELGNARCIEHDLALVDAADLLAAGDDELLGTSVAGRFTVLARIASGSMGAVYRARQEAFSRDVALKILRRDRVLDDESYARFEREARATSSLASPHTVTVLDYGEARPGTWYLAMELLQGETLGARLRRQGALAPEQAVRFARQALASLAEAHALGIVHRDLKPDNLFLVRGVGEQGERELVKVLDFGIAKLLRDDGRIDQLETQAGTVFGTPRYMSPEQAAGAPLDARSDLYSLGVILFQMLTGRAPFVDDDAVVVMARHIKDPVPTFAEVASERGLSPRLEEVVQRALAKRADDRPESALVFAAALERVELRAPVAVTPTERLSTWTAPAAPASPWRWPLVLGSSAVLALVLFSWRPSRAPEAVRVAAAPAPIFIAAAPASTAAASSEAPAPLPAVSSAAPARTARPRVAPARTSSPARRGPNERYGRFE